MKVDLTNKGAIYVDGMRATHRGTKWGIHNIIHSFDIQNIDDLEEECRTRGFGKHADNIDPTRPSVNPE